MDIFNFFSPFKVDKKEETSVDYSRSTNLSLKRPLEEGSNDECKPKVVKVEATQPMFEMKNNHDLKSPYFQLKSPFSHIQSGLTPQIRPGVVSLSKTMDSPLVAISHTPVHLSNNSNRGFILPAAIPSKPPAPAKPINTITPSQCFIQPSKVPSNQNMTKSVIDKSLPTIRLSSSIPQHQVINKTGIKINTIGNSNIITITPSTSKVVINMNAENSQLVKTIPAKNVISDEVKPVPTSNQLDKENSNTNLNNNIDIFEFSPKLNYKDIPKEYENDLLDFAEYTHNEAYSNYEPAKLKIGEQHPFTVVESRSLNSTTAPDITYDLKLPEIIISKGILSNVQLEAVVYACQKHEEDFHDDKRLGFLIGDGAGVGKGRTIAGIILENYLSGRKRSIWVSVSSDLKQDAERDIGDIGNPIGVQIKVAALSKMNYNQINSKENGNFEEGVLFVSYSSLIGNCKNLEKNQFKKRLDQIIDWFGEDYDGVIVFDECHKAKNLHQNNKTKTGSVVKKLQNELKFARVVYASATGASEPKHMAYMVRLGLWGPGKRFFNFEEFESTLTTLGVGAMELIAIEMKKNGVYLARQLSFDKVKFEISEIEIEKSTINGHKFKDVYNKCVEVWINIYNEFNVAFRRNKLDDKDECNFEAQFWSAHQRFFKYLCIAGKIEECVRIAKFQVEQENKCVVIGLQSTGEARTVDLLDETSGNYDHFISSAKGVVENLIKNHYPSMKTQEKNKAKRNLKSMNLRDLSFSPQLSSNNNNNKFLNNSGLTPQSVSSSSIDDEGERRLLSYVEEIDSMFPLNALDQLIHMLGGPSNVAEMTGRKGRMLEQNGTISYQLRKIEDHGVDQTNMIEKSLFNEGDKHYAIISDAASTGISLHSDKRFKNQRKRFHITLELPWSADKAIQQFGRTHRSNQVNTPHYMFLISDLAGERRFAATVAKRLESLGALTHGDRRSVDTRDLSQFNLDNDIGSKAVHHLVNSIITEESQSVLYPKKYLKLFNNNIESFRISAQGALGSVGLNKVKFVTVTKFLNRILGIELDMQNALFQYFLDIVENESQKAKSRNDFDHGIRDIINEEGNLYVTESITFKTNSKYDDGNIVVNTIKNTSGNSWESVILRYDKHNKRQTRFYISKSTKDKEIKLLAFAEKKENGLYLLMRPNFPAKEIDKTALNQKWVKTAPKHIKSDWEFIYRESKDKCVHRIFNTHCNNKDCTNGKRTKINYLITGAVLLALKIVDSAKINKKLEIIRVQLFDNTKLIGALVPQPYYKAVMKALKTGYDVPSVEQFSVNDGESSDESNDKKNGTRRRVIKRENINNKKILPPSNWDYSRINQVIQIQLKKSINTTKPSDSETDFKKPVVKKELKVEEKKKARKDFQFPKVIVNFLSEEDLE